MGECQGRRHNKKDHAVQTCPTIVLTGACTFYKECSNLEMVGQNICP